MPSKSSKPISQPDDQYSDKEATQRMEKALRHALNTPPTPLKKYVGKSTKAKPSKPKKAPR